MKKLILFAAILFAGVSVVKAQGDPTGDNTVKEQSVATTTLKLELTNFQHIEVATSKNEVLLKYETLANYTAGVNSEAQNTKTNHLKVSSTGGFKVNVKATDFKNGVNTIPIRTVDILASGGTNSINGTVYTAKTSLSNDNNLLFSSTKGGINAEINVAFYGANENIYAEYFAGGITDDNSANSVVYESEVTYTIVPN